MVPNYEELVILNPRLRNKSQDEFEKLIQTIISKGFVWKRKQKFFYHEGIGVHIRTAGLDLFTPESFLRACDAWSNKNITYGMRLGTQFIPKLLLAFFIDLSLGWILIPVTFWAFSLLSLLIAIFIIYVRSRRKVKLGRKELRVSP